MPQAFKTRRPRRPPRTPRPFRMPRPYRMRPRQPHQRSRTETQPPPQLCPPSESSASAACSFAPTIPNRLPSGIAFTWESPGPHQLRSALLAHRSKYHGRRALLPNHQISRRPASGVDGMLYEKSEISQRIRSRTQTLGRLSMSSLAKLSGTWM
jgi:hypothetical protein